MFVTFLSLQSGVALAQIPAQVPAPRTAVVAVGGDPGHLNPAISTAMPLHAVASSMFNGLVSLDRDGTVQPDLATSRSVSEDGREVRLHGGRETGARAVMEAPGT